MKKLLVVLVSLALLILVFSSAASSAYASTVLDWNGEGFAAQWNVKGVSIVAVITTMSSYPSGPRWIYMSARNTQIKQDFSGYMIDLLPSSLYVRTALPLTLDDGHVAMYTIEISFYQTTIPFFTATAYTSLGIGDVSMLMPYGQYTYGIAVLQIDGDSLCKPVYSVCSDAFAFITTGSSVEIRVP